MILHLFKDERPHQIGVDIAKLSPVASLSFNFRQSFRFLATFGDDGKLRTLRQKAGGRRQKGFKDFAFHYGVCDL
ncbi:hypothetical protein H6G96_38920 [Nostoc sp. FACHB-892]|uniref:hypothetical protein n=1 Tax=Nostoc sp. FACHB-892 TaxID=2692843 RepID=UPI001689846E|nr:hypothetical protein [Nostoc sp. FACHB-892]MBD2732071.1 hypothetical protein [Nostoc sp. FACHB-892]